MLLKKLKNHKYSKENYGKNKSIPFKSKNTKAYIRWKILIILIS